MDIDEMIAVGTKTFSELLEGLVTKGYEIKQGKQLAFRMQGSKRFLRLDTLGEEYTEANLKRRIADGGSIIEVPETNRDFDLVLDMRKIIEKNKGANYERWAKRFNLKQVAKSICFIQEHGIKTYDDLVAMTENASKRFDELSESIKYKQKRLEEIAEQRKQIVNFVKTRETYEAYKHSGYSRKFFESNREELQLHKAAKEYFNAHGITKFPKMKELSDEYGMILDEKKKDYAEYKEAKATMQDFMIARQNLESLHGAEGKNVDEREEKNIKNIKR